MNFSLTIKSYLSVLCDSPLPHLIKCVPHNYPHNKISLLPFTTKKQEIGTLSNFPNVPPPLHVNKIIHQAWCSYITIKKIGNDHR